MGQRGPASTRELDVRDLDEPPFEPITDALSDLGSEEALVIINEFEPEPLYDTLERRGFNHHTAQVGPEEWRVVVTRA
ncbi:DUF2249 domain-containing protein [Halobaculum limi]|uniref:DUF2249 domain-containing protein n=1 Tax=Halobaculum limi TaxID=3031916 RepID=UPI002404C342|nr:DUF2249 domain-containing protein [Halobaculum sp. YSMS11]